MAEQPPLKQSGGEKRRGRPAKDRPDIPSYRDIAAKTGVSAQTVSYVVRNIPKVSEETKARVIAAMQRLGYRPQPAMSALMRQYRLHPSKRDVMKMAFINSWNEPFAQAKAEPLRQFYLGARARAEDLGYLVEDFQGGETPDQQAKLRKRLRFSGAEGIMVFPTINPSSGLDIEWGSYSIVEIGQTLHGVPLTLITPDHFENTTLLCRRVLDAGFERIGFVQDHDIHERVGGSYLAAFLASAWPNERKRILPPLMREAIREADVVRYVKSHKCDALLVGPHFDPYWLTNAGIKVPKDVSLAGYSLYSDEVKLGMAGIDEHWAQIGEKAAEYLARLMQTNTRGFPATSEVVHISGQWVEGRLFSAKNTSATSARRRALRKP